MCDPSSYPTPSIRQTTMHDTVLPMAFNSRPKVTFSDQGHESDNAAEVQFTFGKGEVVEEDETEAGTYSSDFNKEEGETEAVYSSDFNSEREATSRPSSVQLASLTEKASEATKGM